jgi:hypothetical protein
MTPPPQMQAPEPPTSKTRNKPSMSQRLFGDTLTKNHQNFVRNVQSRPDRIIKLNESVKPTSKVAILPAKTSPMSKIAPFSYLRREKTFDMSLMHPESKEKFKPKYSPQFQKKQYVEPIKPVEMRQMSTSERYQANVANRASAGPMKNQPDRDRPELINSSKVRHSMAVTKNEKMKTFDKKPFDKIPLKKLPVISSALEKTSARPNDPKKSSEKSAISNPTVSASSSFKYSKPTPYEAKDPENVQYQRNGELITLSRERENILKEDVQQSMNNFYFGMQEASVDTDNEDHDDNEAEQTQMEAINRFAEDIFKMSGGGAYLPNSQCKAFANSLIF